MLREKSRIIFFMRQSAVGSRQFAFGTGEVAGLTPQPYDCLTPTADCLISSECEGIENRHIKMGEIPGVVRDQRQSMHLSRGGDQRIFIGMI